MMFKDLLSIYRLCVINLCIYVVYLAFMIYYFSMLSIYLYNIIKTLFVSGLYLRFDTNVFSTEIALRDDSRAQTMIY